MKNKKPLILLSLFTAAIILLFSCQKEAVDDTGNLPAGKSQLQVMLTDDPSQIFDSIFIDIRKL